MRAFVKYFLLIAIVGLCLCAAVAATPTPTWGLHQTVRTPSTATEPQVTVPPVAGISTHGSATPVAKITSQAPRATTSPTVRSTTPSTRVSVKATATAPPVRPTTPRHTATPTTKTVTKTPTAAPTVPPAGPNLTVPRATGTVMAVATNLTTPLPAVSINDSVPTPWLAVTAYPTTYDYFYPTEDRTPDIDPGMTPYSGATVMETLEPTPAWETPTPIMEYPTPTEYPAPVAPNYTPAAETTQPFELPPGAYGVEQTPTPSETMAPLPGAEPQDAAGASSMPRWLSYLLFVLLGITGVAGVALVGARVGSRSPDEPGGAATPLRAIPPRPTEVRLLRPQAPEPTPEQQILLDRIAEMDPRSMRVERLGETLLRFEHAAQSAAQDRAPGLGSVLALDAIPSLRVPSTATAWARDHGFSVLAVDGSGMALVMPALSTGGRTVLGVLPVDEMVGGASPAPMPIRCAERARRGALRAAAPAPAIGR